MSAYDEFPSTARYGVRWARWIDNGERIGIATIDGEPVGIKPTDEALEHYAEKKGMVLISQEFMQDLLIRRKL